ncbi:MAG TPA: DUF4342 domain-containing protein [Candidatus Limnocylindria bacterium]|nr:DUF4342 domain-containing protein [Candidatus Limnocylindria bacterium]
MPATISRETLSETFSGETVDKVVARIRELVHEGNVRRVIVKDAAGATIIEAPLTVGVVGAALAPAVAAIGAVVALVSDCTITVEKRLPA